MKGDLQTFFTQELPEAATLAAQSIKIDGGGAGEWGITLMTSFGTGIWGGVAAVQDRIDQVKQVIQAKFRSIADDMPGIAKDILQGLADGLTSQLDVVEIAAGGVGASAVRALRGPKGVHAQSPSKKTFGAGIDTGMGLVLGMESMLPKVAEMAARAGHLAAGPTSLSLPAGYGSRSTSQTVSQTNHFSIPITAATSHARDIAGAARSAVSSGMTDSKRMLAEELAVG